VFEKNLIHETLKDLNHFDVARHLMEKYAQLRPLQLSVRNASSLTSCAG
jgi:hypothetical protein